MWNVLACFGGLGLLLMVGHAQLTDVAVGENPVVAPAWVLLPENGEVISVALDGGAGNETALGFVDVALAGAPGPVLAAFKARLAQGGYVVDNAITEADALFRAPAMLVAKDPVTGRRLRIVQLNPSPAPVLRVFFSDPSAEFAQIRS